MVTGDPADLSRLVERARSGDRRAMELVLAHVAPIIRRFGVRMCGNEHDADDVLQETLLAVTKHLGAFEGRSALSSWVFTLARTACARRRRGLKNRPPIGEEHRTEEVDERPDPESAVESRELVAALTRAMGRLPDDYREVLLLRDVEGLSAAEVAPVLGISVDALKSRLHRAREALRTQLRPMLEPALGTPNSCPDIVAMWSKKLEGDLSQGDCSAMEDHMRTCPSCGSACNALKRALAACKSLGAEEVPVEVQAQIRAAVRAWSTSRGLDRT